MTQEIVFLCPGCNRIRVGGKWQPTGKTKPNGDVSILVCMTCRSNKDIRAELLNDGFLPGEVETLAP